MPLLAVPELKTLVLPLSSLETPLKGIYSLTNSQEPLGGYIQFCFKLLFIEDGKGWYYYSYRRIYAETGDIFLIPPGEVYNLSGLENNKSWLIVFEADILTLNSTDNELLLVSLLRPNATDIFQFKVAPANRPQWIIRLNELEYELRNKPRGFEKSVSALLSLLLIETARVADTQLRNFSLQSKSLLIKVFQLIETNYRNQLRLLDVAKAVNLSPSYLTELVRRNTGKTVLSWIIERRMAEARRLLLTTNLPIYQIAEAVGYLDTSYFIRHFRQHHRSSPQVWRCEYRSG